MSMSIGQWLEANADKYETNGALVKACCKVKKTLPQTVYKAQKRLRDRAAGLSRTVVDAKPSKGRSKGKGKLKNTISARELKASLDVKQQIREGLALVYGGIIKDADLRRALRIAPEDWAEHSVAAEFKPNKLEVARGPKKGLWWGQQDTLADIRESTDIA